jgi:RNA polymerase sigma factor (TIGR02999 family)
MYFFVKGWRRSNRTVPPLPGQRRLAPCRVVFGQAPRILHAIAEGDPAAASQLLPLVYDELRRLAAVHLAREKPGQTLDATALVHEAWVRLAGGQPFESRSHFFRASAEAMRRILVDHARARNADKRGGRWTRVELADWHQVAQAPA